MDFEVERKSETPTISWPGKRVSRAQEHIFFLLSKRQLLEQASLLFQTFSLQKCTNIQAVVEVHGMRFRRACRDVENEQAAGVEQGRQELQLRGKVGQMFEHIE